MLSMPDYSSAKIVKKGQFFPKDYQNTRKRNEKRPSTEIIISRFQWKFFNKEQEQTDIFFQKSFPPRSNMPSL